MAFFEHPRGEGALLTTHKVSKGGQGTDDGSDIGIAVGNREREQKKWGPLVRSSAIVDRDG